jgi:predicted nucleic acid-binding protein
VSRTLVTDTGVLFAALEPREVDHARCYRLLGSGAAVTAPAPVIGELDWLGRSRGRPDVSASVLASVLDGSVVVADLEPEDWKRVRDLLLRYADLPLNLVDASVVAVAERLQEGAIATLDHRHFSVVRPRHVRRFELLPD